MTGPWRVDVPMVAGTLRAPRPWTANERIHWAVRHARTSQIRTTVAALARTLHLGQLGHITAQLHYRPGDNRRRDEDNLTATSKPAFDALVDAGLVPDDTARWMTKLMPVIHEGRGHRELWLEIATGDARPPVQQGRGATNTPTLVSRDGVEAHGATGAVDVGRIDRGVGQ